MDLLSALGFYDTRMGNTVSSASLPAFIIYDAGLLHTPIKSGSSTPSIRVEIT